MVSKKSVSIFWFRQDLRLSDNPGLVEACKVGALIPIYIYDEAGAGAFKMGASSKLWLYHSLVSLNKSLEGKLSVYKGQSKRVILSLVEKYKINHVFWNRCYEPWRVRDDKEIKKVLKERGVDCESLNGSLLWEPWEVLKNDGTPYRVYTPFYRNGCLRSAVPRRPLNKPRNMDLIYNPDSVKISALNLRPSKKWVKKIEDQWSIGEVEAVKKMKNFVNNSVSNYKKERDYPGASGASRLSPHLHFGELSPNQIWHSVYSRKKSSSLNKSEDCFLSEIGWREFSYYLLYHFPNIPSRNFQEKFNAFPWRKNSRVVELWQKGETGYPIVDAGMRELWQTGYMHNRVRMIVASFLVKNLLQHWHLGRDWFWECLLDADLANNSASWQWVAGSGADAAPYFRIFNPVTQAEKFDSEGAYIRKFVPELSKMPNKYLFKPWETPSDVLDQAGVVLGETYPMPIVDLKDSREEALAAYKELTGKR